MQRDTPKVKVLKLQDRDNNLQLSTPEKRIDVMWQLAIDAWAFKGEPVVELRLPRHIIRVLRRKS